MPLNIRSIVDIDQEKEAHERASSLVTLFNGLTPEVKLHIGQTLGLCAEKDRPCMETYERIFVNAGNQKCMEKLESMVSKMHLRANRPKRFLRLPR